MAAPPSLFSTGSRVARGPAPHARPLYELLDRSPFTWAAEVRRVLDEWYRRLPATAAAQIHERFTSTDRMRHLGAFFELYLHELGCQLAEDVDIDVGRDDGDARRPDLLLRCAKEEVFVEATAITGADVHDPQTSQRLDEVYDAIDAVMAPAFDVDVHVDHIASARRAAGSFPGRRSAGWTA